MTRTRRSLVGAIAAAGVLLATAVAAVAETCTLTLKRRETKSAAFDRASYMYWSVRPQYFYVQMNADGERPVAAVPSDQSQAEAFKRIVKKEPKYQSEYPFRGVVKLGSQEYAFALDVAAPARRQGQEAGRQGQVAGAKAATRRRRDIGCAGWQAPDDRRPARSPVPSRFRSRIFPTTGSISISITTAT